MVTKECVNRIYNILDTSFSIKSLLHHKLIQLKQKKNKLLGQNRSKRPPTFLSKLER